MVWLLCMLYVCVNPQNSSSLHANTHRSGNTKKEKEKDFNKLKSPFLTA
jgi:hypothetical protein